MFANRWLAATVAAVAVAGVLVAQPVDAAAPPDGVGSRVADGATADPGVAESPARSAAVRIAAAGDIACAPGYNKTKKTCRHRATARLITRTGAAAVLTLGDNQYEVGAYTAYQQSYARHWGRFHRKVYPIPGNHEYGTARAEGYFSYYGARAHGHPGYYAYNLGRWRVYALNSNCSAINCAKEATWLRNDLAANRRRCVLAYMHHPRFSSGAHGSSTAVTRFWTPLFQQRADVVLGGHDHVYERFARMNPAGGLTKAGIRSFVVGTGGKSLYGFRTNAVDGSRVRVNGSAGVLFLTLRAGSYRWAFKSISGAVRDSGSAACV